MKPRSALLAVALVGGGWLAMLCAGCGGSRVQHVGLDEGGAPSSQPLEISEKHLNSLLTTVSQLYLVSQEALEAAVMVGTPDGELSAAREDLAAGEASLRLGRSSLAGRRYRDGSEELHAAGAAFRRSEESAVRAGLGQLERELATDYGRFRPVDSERRRTTGMVRVSQDRVNLRDGAGADFQVVGKAQLGDTLNLLAESGGWYRVRTSRGVVGWVSKELVTHASIP
jgi:hypothetical protein